MESREELVQEIARLRQRLAELQMTQSQHWQADQFHLKPQGLLQSLIDSLPQNIFSKDRQGRFTFANQRYCQTQGKSLEEILGKTDFDLHPRELAEKYLQDDRRVMEREELFETVEEHQPTGKKKFYVQVIKAPLYDAQGQVHGILGIFWDITERKQAEEEIHWRAQTLAALHETALDLVRQRELPDILQAIVVRAVELLDVKYGGIYLYRADSDDLFSAYTHDMGPEMEGIVLKRGEGLSGKVLESGRPQIVKDYRNWEGRSPNLQVPYFAAGIAVPIHWGTQLLGVLYLGENLPRDFSPEDIDLLNRFAPLAAAALENNRLLNNLRQQMDQLKQAQIHLVQSAKLAAVGELAAGVAHELNNPLTSVLGFAELVLDQVPPGYYRDLETIAREARRARGIVRNLLDFARQTQPIRQPTDVHKMIQQTLAVMRYLLKKGQVTVEEAYDPDIEYLYLDEAQMKQVLLSLISNAIQAMPEGGSLRLRTARVGDEVAISVTDTGPGIPPQDIPHIFDLFFSTKPKSAGLGLPVSMGIVQEHSGRITVESDLGHGSTFTVWLPAHSSSPDELD